MRERLLSSLRTQWHTGRHCDRAPLLRHTRNGLRCCFLLSKRPSHGNAQVAHNIDADGNVAERGLNTSVLGPWNTKKPARFLESRVVNSAESVTDTSHRRIVLISPAPQTHQRATVTCDTHGVVVSCNAAVFDVFGLEPEYIVDRSCKDMLQLLTKQHKRGQLMSDNVRKELRFSRTDIWQDLMKGNRVRERAQYVLGAIRTRRSMLVV